MKVNRRKAIFSVSALLGATAIPAVYWQRQASNSKHSLPLQAEELAWFSPREFDLVTMCADIMIPRTDTPGAVDAGVPQFLDSMIYSWASSETKSRFRRAWQAIDQYLSAKAGQDPWRASKEHQLTNLQALENTIFAGASGGASTHANTQKGKIDTQELRELYLEQKALIAEVYYLSEPGATEELQYELNPSEFIACAPLEEIGRTWATY